MCLAVLLIIFKGTSSNGQISIFNTLLASYIEETAASNTNNATPNQLADINSVFAYTGASGRTVKPSIISMIQDNSIVSRGIILTDIIDEFSDRTDVVEYEVQDGDTISFIASDYGVSINTIIWANNLKSANDIKPGMKLKIPPVDGVVHKVAKGDTIDSVASKYSADSQKIISFNGLPADGSLQIGSEIIIPGGKVKKATPAGNQTAASTAKRFSYLPDLGGFYVLPATGFDWGRVHDRNGVDVANACGTPIYASADGTVNLAKNSGWNGGYGKYIRITHNNGTETLYGHLSKILVSVGEYVARNQQIALMGSTGNSTGCHIHFEVHGARNPLAKF